MGVERHALLVQKNCMEVDCVKNAADSSVLHWNDVLDAVILCGLWKRVYGCLEAGLP
jgi:hypothetical protein